MDMASFGFKDVGRAMKVLLVGVLLSHLGTYMVIPLMPIYLKLEKGMAIAEIGLILAVSPFTFQAASLLGGVLADRLGRRSIMVAGAWLNAVAIAGYAVFDSFGMFIAMGLLSGIGVGLNAPATKAAIAEVASADGNVTSAFSLRGVAANVGIAVAGLLTYFILGGPSVLIFYVSSGLYFLLGVISWLLLPRGCGNVPSESAPLHGYLDIFRNKPFVMFSAVSIAIWALYFQLLLAMPLRAERVLSDPGMVSLVWTLNSVLVIGLQTSISRWIIAKLHPMYALALGVLFVGAGLGSLGLASSLIGLMISGAIFIVGEMLIIPTVDASISRLGAAAMVGAFFGLSNFVAGVGEGAGKFAGGQLLSAGISSAAPWLIFVAAGIIISAVLAGMRFWKPFQASLGMPPAVETGQAAWSPEQRADGADVADIVGAADVADKSKAANKVDGLDKSDARLGGEIRKLADRIWGRKGRFK